MSTSPKTRKPRSTKVVVLPSTSTETLMPLPAAGPTSSVGQTLLSLEPVGSSRWESASVVRI